MSLFPYFPLNLGYKAPLLPTEDLSIFGIEMTQAIQCFNTAAGLATCPNNSLPLVTQKNAAARIYLKYTGTGTSKAGIPVRVHLFANGVEYIADTYGTAWTTIRQDSDTVPKLWFNVNFTNNINVTYYAEVDPNHIYPETNEGNNRFPAVGTQSVTFQKRGTKDIVGWRTRYHPSGYGGLQYAGGWAVNGGGADWLEYIWPVRSGSGINYSLASGYLNWTTALSGGSDSANAAGQHALISTVNSTWIIQNYMSWLFGTGATTGADHVYGWVNSGGYSGGHADMPVYPHAGGLGVVGIGSDAAPGGSSVDNPGSGAVIFGHELTHDYNVYHTNTFDACGSNDGNSDFPYSNSSIQEFGFNPDTGKVYTPALTHDLMSYCPPGSKQGWISPFTWNKMFGKLSSAAVAPSLGLSAAALGEGLAVNATIDNPNIDGDQGGSLGNLFHHNSAVLTVLPPAGGYAVELRNGPQVLASQTFEVSFQSEYSAHGESVGDPSPLPHVDVSFIMAWEAGTTSVALVHNGVTLDEVTVSSAAPVVSVTNPSVPATWLSGTTQAITWTGSDADLDTLSYSVYYSHDGSEWHILAAELSGNAYNVEVDSLAGGVAAHFRVVATDGVNVGQDESAAVSIPNKAPFTAITNPGDGALAPLGGLVVFNGGATDLEDGPIPDGYLSWSSNVDGLLGTGSSLPVNNLTAGLHTITLRATDSNAAFTEESVQIVVGFPLTIDVQPNRMSSVGPPAGVTVVATLPPGYPTENINLNTLRLHINGVELTPTSSEQLGDPDEDGLPELKLTFDGAAVQAALPDGPGSTDAVLDGEMVGGMQIQGSDTIGLALSGDSDCSGIVNAVDALKVLRFVAGFGPSSCILETDVDCNGLVNAVDALKILRFVAGLPPTGLPEGCPGISAPAPAAAVMSTSDRSSPGDAWLGALLAVPALVMAGRRRSR